MADTYKGWQWDDYTLYEASPGDTWDDIASQAYGDGAIMSVLLYANPEKVRILVFEGGEIVKIPVVDERASEALPPWRRG